VSIGRGRFLNGGVGATVEEMKTDLETGRKNEIDETLNLTHISVRTFLFL
jgi:hypothetical protein